MAFYRWVSILGVFILGFLSLGFYRWVFIVGFLSLAFYRRVFIVRFLPLGFLSLGFYRWVFIVGFFVVGIKLDVGKCWLEFKFP